VTSTELLEVIRAGFAAGVGVATASHAAPAEVTASPAVILRPANPWLIPNRRIATCPEVTWLVQVIGGRFDLVSSMAGLAAGYVSAYAALHAARIGHVGALGQVEPTEIATVPYLSATFSVTLPLDLGGL
jgi:hypothetical protein